MQPLTFRLGSIINLIIKKLSLSPYTGLIPLLLLSSCFSAVDIPDFDEQAWRQDARGCQNIRTTLVPVLEKNKDKLMGLTHTQILNLLGKPEGNSLEKSGERVYTYYIQPGPQCQGLQASTELNHLSIRFDALDRVYKVRFNGNL